MVGLTFTSCILPGRETVLIAWVTALEVILRPNSFNKVSTLNTEGATQYGTLG